MAQRELRMVSTDDAIGLVAFDENGPRFERSAVGVFRALRKQLGDEETARALVKDGWSNGYLYLGQPH